MSNGHRGGLLRSAASVLVQSPEVPHPTEDSEGDMLCIVVLWKQWGEAAAATSAPVHSVRFQAHCRHLGCFLCLLKIQHLLSLSSNSDSVCHCNGRRRSADLGSLTVTVERLGPFLRT